MTMFRQNRDGSTVMFARIYPQDKVVFSWLEWNVVSCVYKTIYSGMCW
jgi:hypothetical protein